MSTLGTEMVCRRKGCSSTVTAKLYRDPMTGRTSEVVPPGWTLVSMSGTPQLDWRLCPSCSSEIRDVIERQCGGVSPDAIAAMCHWNADVDQVQRRRSHQRFHFGNPCPYEAMAAVLRGEPDPRGVDLSVP